MGPSLFLCCKEHVLDLVSVRLLDVFVQVIFDLSQFLVTK